jgi:hypothetical protein
LTPSADGATSLQDPLDTRFLAGFSLALMSAR